MFCGPPCGQQRAVMEVGDFQRSGLNVERCDGVGFADHPARRTEYGEGILRHARPDQVPVCGAIGSR